MTEKSKPYLNSYAAGILLGLVLLTTIYITGRGLGASGAVKTVAAVSVKTAAPAHYQENPFYAQYQKNHPGGPLKSWLFWEIIGVALGAFFSGLIANRVTLRLGKGPGVHSVIRLIAALVGGALFGFGSQLGRGCTSGSALSGMAVMSLGGIVTMLAIFGGAYLLAFFFQKLWIRRV
jgi:uncharacterized membrane protein YedE/YeeE